MVKKLAIISTIILSIFTLAAPKSYAAAPENSLNCSQNSSVLQSTTPFSTTDPSQNGTWTLEFWMKTTQQSPFTVFSMPGAVQVYSPSNGHLNAQVTGVLADTATITGNTVINDGKWHLIDIGYNGGLWEIVDNQTVYGEAFLPTNEFINWNSQSKLSFCGNFDTSGNKTDAYLGLIDNPAIYQDIPSGAYPHYDNHFACNYAKDKVSYGQFGITWNFLSEFLFDQTSNGINDNLTPQFGPYQLAGSNIDASSDDPCSPFPGPVISPIPNAAVNEGATYSYTGTFTDPNATSWTGTVDYGSGNGVQPLTINGNTFTLSHQYDRQDNFTIQVDITNANGVTGADDAVITTNEGPVTVSSVSATPNPALVNTSVTATAPFTNPDPNDTNTASWDWGDGHTSNGTITGTNSSYTTSASHIYTATGVYPVQVTVTDDDGVSTTSASNYISVYNPTPAGLFTAGIRFTSPPGAYLQNPTTTGSVTFNLGYKYQGNTPQTIRNFTMNFPTANLNFAATAVTSLVTANGTATLMGRGTINNTGTDNFVVVGNQSQRKIRIQITDQNGRVVYDTQPGAPITATPTTSVTGFVVVN